MQFASRSDFGEKTSPYGEAFARARIRPGFLDLTISNPTRCGFHYPPSIADTLCDPRVLQYEAHPLGMSSAREVVAGLYAEHYGAAVSADNVVLTASTSEAYGYLLRLLCEPGDAILVPSPSYPLFDLLARLHDVDLVPYPLVYHDGWQIDPASLAAAVTPRTRAIVTIHPNNPTGHYCSASDREALYSVAREHDLALIVDEVFLDYAVEADGEATLAASDPPVLTLVLGGLSKLLALPQMKLAWTIVCGPPTAVAAARHRLEVIADTFLSVATPPQLALPQWLSHRAVIQTQIKSRVTSNLRALDQMIGGSVVSRLKMEGGWAVVLRIPATCDDHEFAVRLLEERGVCVHPGSFYGFPGSGWLVISLLPEPDIFHSGIASFLATWDHGY